MSGQVKAVRETSDGREGVLRLVRAGEIFGLARDWEVDVHRALDDAHLLRLPWHDMLLLVGQHPEAAAALLNQRSARLVEADTRICTLQTESVENRLGATLRRLAVAIGAPAAAGIALDLPLSRQGLGDPCGATESTVSRILNAWSRLGIIDIARHHIVPLRPGDLSSPATGAARRAAVRPVRGTVTARRRTRPPGGRDNTAGTP